VGLLISETTVSGNASAAVTFTAINPVINSFTSQCPSSPGFDPGPNTICYDGSGNIAASDEVVFTWSVTGATRYELYGAGGYLYYSGTATAFNPAGLTNHYFNGTWTIKAYNGSAVTVMQYTPTFIDITPPSQSG